MSLNGLDDVKVIEAHDAALAELGGWFLLKYASRDEVELLGKGTGGIVEIRNSIAQYGESSPLFGFLRYRRRSVLIKYVPDDCSRLIQARVSVHFTAFSERFSPHDTIFPIATSKELRDTSLSAACSLHTASGSTSSSTSSLRRRRLMEIAEEAEEDQRVKRQSIVQEERSATGKESTTQDQLAPDGDVPFVKPRSVSVDPGNLSTIPTSAQAPASPEARRLSSQSVRPDMYTLSSYGTSNKPKIRLAPRPSLDHKALSDSPYRPVASLPAGLKLFRKGSKKEKSRPKSTYHSAGTTLPIPGDTSSLSEMRDPIRPHTSGGRPVTSSGASIRNNQTGPPLPGPPPSTVPSRSLSTTSTMTPEKARLMKALQLRKKQLGTTGPESTPKAAEQSEEPEVSSAPSHALNEVVDNGQNNDRLSNAVEIDSGIGIMTGYTTQDLCSELTKTDSSLTSPMGTENAASTEASSLSESTDETVQESTYQKENLAVEEAIPETRGEGEIGNNEIRSLSDVDEVAEDEAGEEEAPKGDTPEHKKDEVETVQFSANITEPSDPSPGQDLHIPNEIDENLVEPSQAPNLNVKDHQQESVVSLPSIEEPVNEASGIPEREGSSPAIPDADPIRQDETPVELQASREEEIPVASVSQSLQTDVEPPTGNISESPTATSSPARDLKLPRSKFSKPDLKDAAEIVSSHQHALQDSTTQQLPQITSGVEETGLLEDKENSHRHRRKTSQVDRIRIDISTDISAANSDNEFLEDDDLMDELQSATVQEAKPISVAKSPMSQLFPVSPHNRNSNRYSRVLSNPIMSNELRNLALTPPEKVQIGRSMSAGDAFLSRINQQKSGPVAKKVTVGSGISQRIKALEKLSSAAPSTGTPPTSGTPSPAFFSVKQASIRRAKSPSIADRANSFTNTSPSLSRTPSFSPDTSPDMTRLRDRAGSIQSRKEVFNTNTSSRPMTTGSSRPPSRPESRPSSRPESRPESVSVTARIVRDPNQPFPQLSDPSKDPSDYGPLDLKSSLLTIDHQKAVPKDKTTQEPRSPKEIKDERRSSMTVVRELLTSPRRSSFSSTGRRSVNLERSESPPHDSSNSRPLSITSRRSSRGNGLSPSPSAGTGLSSPPSKPPLSGSNAKSEGRGMKMLRRMSSGFSNGRKTISNAISPTLREEKETDTAPITPLEMPSPSLINTDIGDVNVQIPDTLFWKRRHLLLDSQGFLVLSALQSQSNAVALTKRYHMSDFRRPVVPDLDAQELPNSVSMDLVQGGGPLQFACEDRAAQMHVLHILEDAHKTWANSQAS